MTVKVCTCCGEHKDIAFTGQIAGEEITLCKDCHKKHNNAINFVEQRGKATP